MEIVDTGLRRRPRCGWPGRGQLDRRAVRAETMAETMPAIDASSPLIVVISVRGSEPWGADGGAATGTSTIDVTVVTDGRGADGADAPGLGVGAATGRVLVITVGDGVDCGAGFASPVSARNELYE